MNKEQTEISYSDVLETPVYLEFKNKFKWDKMFIHTIGIFLAKKDANGPDLDIDLSPQALLDAMKKSIETGEDLVLPASKTHEMSFVEEFMLDDDEIKEIIDRIRKHPVRIRPRFDLCGVATHPDIMLLEEMSYNRHGYTKDFIDLKGAKFQDKRFEKYLGDDY